MLKVITHVAVLMMALSVSTKANSHSWYDPDCCHKLDCSEVTEYINPKQTSSSDNSLGPRVYCTKYGCGPMTAQTQIKKSQDMFLHACIVKPYMGGPAYVRCLYIPDGL